MSKVYEKNNFDLLINESIQLIWKFVEIIKASRKNNQKFHNSKFFVRYSIFIN
jgi:hypothetical protein